MKKSDFTQFATSVRDEVVSNIFFYIAHCGQLPCSEIDSYALAIGNDSGDMGVMEAKHFKSGNTEDLKKKAIQLLAGFYKLSPSLPLFSYEKIEFRHQAGGLWIKGVGGFTLCGPELRVSELCLFMALKKLKSATKS